MSATASLLPEPSPLHTCAVVGCNEPATQNHHASYRGRHNGPTVPYCGRHHELLHELHDHVRDDGVTLDAFTLVFTLYPTRTESRVRNHIRLTARVPPPKIEPRQLSFADLHGRNGDYWRSWLQNHG